MEHKTYIILATCLIIACGQANSATDRTTYGIVPLLNDVSTQSIESSSSSTTTPTTSSSTIKPTTAPPTTAPPTTAPPTTAPPPPPTTAAPTTTSTVAPVTTTTPKPMPVPETGKWQFVNKTDNKTCIIVQMALQFNITYEVKGSHYETLFNLPVNDTNVKEGNCGALNQDITLFWQTKDANKTIHNNTLSFFFTKNETSNKFSLSKVNAVVYEDVENFPNANESIPLFLEHNETVFNAPLTMSYRCGKVQNITLNANTSFIFIDHVQIQAFHNDKGSTFGSAVDCDYVDVPDIVPIAVGCALGALVLIVLIAYLVGRRRNRARGYLSM